MDITPLINNLEILRVFKDKDKEEGNSVINSLSIMLRLLGEELKAASWLIKARSRMEPIELCDEEW